MQQKQVIVVSGHLIDTADRPVPRFPEDRVPWVTGQIETILDEWQVAASTTLICGGGRGADIIAAEAALARGARVVVCLALPPDRFVERSVDLPGTDWAERFHHLLTVADVRELRDPPAGNAVFARTNEWIVDLAQSMHPEPRALLIWNGQAGDGAGGTADMVDRLGYDRDDPRIYIVDPTPTPS